MLVEGGRGSSSSMWQALTSAPRVRAGANPAAASVLPTRDAASPDAATLATEVRG